MRNTKWYALPTLAAALVLATGVAIAGDNEDDSHHEGQWPIVGHDLSNTRSEPSEHRIGRSNVHLLTPRWVFTAAASVSVTPVVAGDQVYFPDWAGNIYAVDRETGKQLWSMKVSDYDGVAGAVARTSLAVHGDELFFGDNQGYTGPHGGANLIAVNRFTGSLRWMTQIDPHVAAIVTGPPVVAGDVVYQGISSSEEFLADIPGYPCCTFRGSVVAVDTEDGHILWKTYDMPDNHGSTTEYSGGAIWQPPVIDREHGVLYIGTGNNYTAPASALACQAANPTASNCLAPDDYADTALALDLETGAVRWSRRLQGYDVWTIACVRPKPGTTCPSPKGPDYDLGGSGPNLRGRFLGFGQKSGIFWRLNPKDGSIVWGTPVGPGGSLGGIEWGTAIDGERIYVAIGNNGHTAYTLTNGTTITWGSWSALDPATGKILWQTADPTSGALDTGSVSVANGLLYAGSYDGHMYALDTSTGAILWSFASGGSVIDGPSIVEGVVYWGSGYPRSGGKANNQVYAFAVSSHEPGEDKEE